MNFLIVLFISLFFAHLLARLFSYFKLPKVLGHMVVGFFLGSSLIKPILFDATVQEIFSNLANLGVIFLLYYIGLEINLKEMLKLSKSAISISVLSAIVPFVLGYIFSVFTD